MVNLLKTHSCKTILISSPLRDWDLLVSTRYISRRIRPKLPPTPNSKKYISGWSDKNLKNKWLNWHSSDIQAFRSPKSQMFILSLGSRGKETILFSQYMYIVVSNLLQTGGPSYITHYTCLLFLTVDKSAFHPKKTLRWKRFKTT